MKDEGNGISALLNTIIVTNGQLNTRTLVMAGAGVCVAYWLKRRYDRKLKAVESRLEELEKKGD